MLSRDLELCGYEPKTPSEIGIPRVSKILKLVVFFTSFYPVIDECVLDRWYL
jgi:hypothetical protein